MNPINTIPGANMRCRNCGSTGYMLVNAGPLPDSLRGDSKAIQEQFRPKKRICDRCGSDDIEYLPAELPDADGRRALD